MENSTKKVKTLFPEKTAQEFIFRLNKLASNSPPLWGKMSSAQMLAHCCEVTKEPLGEKEIAMVDLDEKTRKLLLFDITKDDAPMTKGIDADEGSVIVGDRDFEIEKMNFIATIEKLRTGSEIEFEGRFHPFFGKMTATEWPILTYKHLDHHFRQFGV